MARDLRHGPAKKAGFTRRSQAGQPQSKEPSDPAATKKLWLTTGGMTLGLITAFFVAQHFMQKNTGVSVDLVPETKQLDTTVSEPQEIIPSATRPAETENAVQSLTVPSETETQVSEPAENALNQPTYRFYHELLHTEVVVDAEPLPLELPQPMWIQAGSFRQLEQAQREQKRLSNDQRQFDISSTESRNGVVYRLMLGPFTDRIALNQQRNELRRLGADTQLIRSRSSKP
jgi:cell division septation protein DedD